MSATASWTFHCDRCSHYATVAGTDLKEAENTLISVLGWKSSGNWRHECNHHPENVEEPT